jgi:hypothetical protein
MATFTEIWSSLQESGQPPPYLLIDCAGIEGGADRIPKHIFSELECLFTGDLAIELADVGPYLGSLKSFGSEIFNEVEDLLTRSIGILVVLNATLPEGTDRSFSQLHRHFRKFNVVYGPAGKPLFFRYYDPRTVGDVLKVLDAKQLDDFFGIVSTFVLIQDTKQVIQYQQQTGELIFLA